MTKAAVKSTEERKQEAENNKKYINPGNWLGNMPPIHRSDKVEHKAPPITEE